MNRIIKTEDEKRFMDFKEFCAYMNIGQTKGRELIQEKHGFALNIGGKWLIDKTKLNKWIEARLI